MPRNAGHRKGRSKVSKTEQELKYKLEDVQIELDRRCDRIMQESEEAILALKNCLSVQLAKLPTAVRQHKVQPLWQDCQQSVARLMAAATAPATRQPLGVSSGASLLSAAKARIGSKRSAIQTISHVSKKSRIGSGVPGAAGGRVVPKTPGARGATRGVVAGAMRSARPGAAHSRLPTTPGTAMRRARRGEMLLSANGSPITMAGPRARAVVGGSALGGASGGASGATSGGGGTASSSSSSSAPAGGADGDKADDMEEEGIAIDVALADGMAVDVSNPAALAGLQGEDKDRAVQQLLELQAKLASIVGSLQGGSGAAGVKGGAAASGAATGGAPAGSSD